MFPQWYDHCEATVNLNDAHCSEDGSRIVDSSSSRSGGTANKCTIGDSRSIRQAAGNRLFGVGYRSGRIIVCTRQRYALGKVSKFPSTAAAARFRGSKATRYIVMVPPRISQAGQAVLGAPKEKQQPARGARVSLLPQPLEPPDLNRSTADYEPVACAIRHRYSLELRGHRNLSGFCIQRAAKAYLIRAPSARAEAPYRRRRRFDVRLTGWSARLLREK